MQFSQLLMEGHTRLANDIRPIQPVFLFHSIRDMYSLTHDVKLYIYLMHGNVLLSLHLSSVSPCPWIQIADTT
jgi:hypothetical protein